MYLKCGLFDKYTLKSSKNNYVWMNKKSGGFLDEARMGEGEKKILDRWVEIARDMEQKMEDSDSTVKDDDGSKIDWLQIA